MKKLALLLIPLLVGSCSAVSNFEKNKRVIEQPEGINILEGGNLNYRTYQKYDKGIRCFRHASMVDTAGIPYMLIKAQKADNAVWFSWSKWKTFEEYPEDTTGLKLQMFDYASGRVDTENRIAVDLTIPGELTTMICLNDSNPGTNKAIWIYYEEHPTDPYSHGDRHVYVELDILEFGVKGFVFTDHIGTGSSYPHSIESHRKFLKTNRTGIYYSQFKWDGNNNFEWWLSGVMMKRRYIELPENIKPFIILSQGVTDDCEPSSFAVFWSVLSN